MKDFGVFAIRDANGLVRPAAFCSAG